MTNEQLSELCYFVNDWLRMMGGGREYGRLSTFINSIAKTFPDFDFSKYYYIQYVL